MTSPVWLEEEFQSQVDSFLSDAPMTANIRLDNPNLRPVEGGKGEAEAKPSRTRRKPVGPEPMEPVLPVEVNDSTTHKSDQHFWKFHVLRYGTDMYLTTNPTLRHLHMRCAPGYHVRVGPSEGGFTMAFRDFESGTEILRIRKHSKEDGSFFRFKMKLMRSVVDGVLTENLEGPVFEQFLRPHSIAREFYPVQPEVPMTSYEFIDFNENSWSVGSIPRVRQKWNLTGEPGVKYVGKQNVYLHNNFSKPATLLDDIPPVISVFRACESRPKKRMIRTLNRLLKGDSGETIKSENDPYSDIKTYYRGGDGLYFDQVPKDDEPDHRFKLGWLTVYEDNLFEQPGMFDMVVALTVAVGCEKHFEGLE